MLGFCILYQQNHRNYRIINTVDYRTADIYKYLEWDKKITKDIEKVGIKVDLVQSTLDSNIWYLYRLVEYAEE